MSIKQNMVVYHEVYGRGRVLDVKYRKDNSLLFCSFKKGEYGFTTERELMRGDGEITLKPVSPMVKRREMSLEDALRGLMNRGGGGHSPID